MAIRRVHNDHPIRGFMTPPDYGDYWPSIPQWWGEVHGLLTDCGFPPERGVDDPPVLYGVSGRWILPLMGVEETRLMVAIYRMPGGGTYPCHRGDYEIVAYLT